MNKRFSVLLFFIWFIFQANSQNSFSSSWEKIEKELLEWDYLKGKWLSSSLVAMSENRITEERTFQDATTPFEMIKSIPNDKINRINNLLNFPIENNSSEEKKWNFIKKIFNQLGCSILSGRSYGDPHITTFDNANYSFQTVGEFVLMKIPERGLEVQCRQKPQNENFSLNTAIAINLGGDIVGLYAADSPDKTSTLRINGSSYNEGADFLLPHGGSIRVQGKNYIFSAPSGEIITAEIRQSGGFSFINVSSQVFTCSKEQIIGLLGNANGNVDDDTFSNSRKPGVTYSTLFGNALFSKMGNQMEKQYLMYLANEFADEYRVDNETTLFEYGPGENTSFFTDKSFPRTHLTLNDLTPQQQTRAKEKCEARGISENDMRGCIFDQGFLELDPSPRTPIPDFKNNSALNLSPRNQMISVPAIEKPNIKNPIINSPNQPNQIGNLINSVVPVKKPIPSIATPSPKGSSPAIKNPISTPQTPKIIKGK